MSILDGNEAAAWYCRRTDADGARRCGLVLRALWDIRALVQHVCDESGGEFVPHVLYRSGEKWYIYGGIWSAAADPADMLGKNVGDKSGGRGVGSVVWHIYW